MLQELNPQNIQDVAGAREAIVRILNIVAELQQDNRSLRAENQRLRDEVNRLKGEQGKPNIKANKQSRDHSSEKERQVGKAKPKRKKRRPHKMVAVDREEIVRVQSNQLPVDAQFKGYERVIVQDLLIQSDNICFRKEKWYAASTNRSYIASLPQGYQGQFGPRVRALVIALYYSGGMSEPKIIELIEQMGVTVSKGTVSAWLSQQTEHWEQEADAIVRAGLGSSSWQHIDDTSTRVNGVNHWCHILCNPFYTAYATHKRRDRLTVIRVLQNSRELVYQYSKLTTPWLKRFALPKWVQEAILTWPQDRILTEQEVTCLLDGELTERLNDHQLARVREAGALTAYYAQDHYPVVPILVSDDALQFRYLTAFHMLCWVHEGRHYKKLTPQIAYHQQILAEVQTQFWDFYRQLQAYRLAPDPITAAALRTQFDTIFSQSTDYAQLNRRLAKTLAHKASLLVVLDHPEVPLHNNPAELGARQRVRKRDVSFGPRTEAGRVAWDTLMTLAETAKKLNVSFYAYVLDRVSQTNSLPSLADLIRSRSQPLTV